MLKKFLIGTLVLAGIAVFAASASADCSITTTLKVGSKGAEVSCLQTKVGATSDGSFGPMTKASVMAYQAGHGLSADGVVGPLSRAVLNGSPVVTTTVAGCPAGALFNSLTGASCTSTSSVAGCAAGALFSATTGASCTTGATGATGGTTIVNGTEGTLTFEYNSIPAASTSLQKGENLAVVAFKMKATNGDVKVSRLWVDVTGFRPWLGADTATLMDGSTVLGTVNLSSSTVTELTSSSWEIQFNGLNYVVPTGATKILTVKMNRPTLTVQDTGTLVVKASSSIRTVDGSGYSESKLVGTDRNISFATGTSATGTITATLSATSPLEQSVSGLSSTSGVTTAVKLMDFDLKATDGIVNVTDIIGTITTTGCTTIDACISSVELRDGSTVLGSETVVNATGAYHFADLNFNVAQDTTKTLSVWAVVNAVATNYVVAGNTIKANISDVTATSGTNYSDATGTITVTGNKIYLFKYAPTFTLGAVSATQADESTSASVQKGANYSLAFTVAAPSGSDIYVDTANLIVTKSVLTTGAAIAPNTTVSGVSSKGTSNPTYDKVSAGTSRTFTITGYVAHGGSTAGFISMNLTSIPWSATDTTISSGQQTWGLSDFKTPSVYVSL